MKRIFAPTIAVMFLISCASNSAGTKKESQKPEELTEVRNDSFTRKALPKNDVPVRIERSEKTKQDTLIRQ